MAPNEEWMNNFDFEQYFYVSTQAWLLWHGRLEVELHWWWFRQLVVALIRIAILFLHHHHHHHNHQYISSSPSLSNESKVKKQNVIDSSMSPIKIICIIKIRKTFPQCSWTFWKWQGKAERWRPRWWCMVLNWPLYRTESSELVISLPQLKPCGELQISMMPPFVNSLNTSCTASSQS